MYEAVGPTALKDGARPTPLFAQSLSCFANAPPNLPTFAVRVATSGLSNPWTSDEKQRRGDRCLKKITWKSPNVRHACCHCNFKLQSKCRYLVGSPQLTSV